MNSQKCMWKTIEGGDFKCSRIIARAMQVYWSARLMVLYRSRFSVSTSRMVLYHHTDIIGWLWMLILKRWRTKCFIQIIAALLNTTYHPIFCGNQSLFLTVQYPQNILPWTKSKKATFWFHCRISICFCWHLSTTDRTQNYISFKNYNIMPEIFNIEYVFKVSCLKIDLFCSFEYSYQITKITPQNTGLWL